MSTTLIDLWHETNESLRILIWPVLVGTLLFFARKELLGLLQRVKGMRYDKFELELQAKTIAASTEVSVIETAREIAPPFDWEERRKAAITSPTETVSTSWTELEISIQQFFKRRSDRPWPGVLKAVSEMSQAGEITRDEATVFSRLYELRNLLVYEIGSIDNPTSYVLEFVRMTNVLKLSMQNKGPADQ